MKTRAQRKMQEEAQLLKNKPVSTKKTKRQLLQEKNKRNAPAMNESTGGRKKIKDQPVSPQQTRRSKMAPVRVTEPQPVKLKKKKQTQVATSDKKKAQSNEKKEQEIDRQRKKGSVKKQKAKDAQEVQQKNSAKDDLKEKKETVKEAAKEDEKQVIKTVQFKGKVPIDEHCDLKATNFHILEHDGKVYSATLNQTSVTNNNNKFYILQIIQQDNNPNSCYFYTRWGRVGVRGQDSRLGPMPIASAIREYKLKYHEKHNKGNYQEIALNFEEDDKDDKNDNNSQSKSQMKNAQNSEFQQSKLPTPVKKLIELIFDLNMMNNQMIQIGYNVKKMPLGRLHNDTIKRGYNILQKLMNQVQGKKNKEIIQKYSSEFYTVIPHDFGFQKMSNFILKDEKMVKEKIQMLEALAEIRVATDLIDSGKQAENRLDSNYKKLNRDFEAIAKDTAQFQLINNYLQTTHASTHTSYHLELVDLFSLKSEAENVRFTKDIENKMLLWHGSRLTNFVGILSQGLRIAPPQAPVTGYMFGKGVYFADMSSKSANYCFTSRESSTGILLLCQVALGQMNEKFTADYYANLLPPGKQSTKGMGRTAPNPVNAVKMDDGVVIPMGPGEPTSLACTLLYNEFIVYDIAQIKIRYLLRTKFNYPSR